MSRGEDSERTVGARQNDERLSTATDLTTIKLIGRDPLASKSQCRVSSDQAVRVCLSADPATHRRIRYKTYRNFVAQLTKTP